MNWYDKYTSRMSASGSNVRDRQLTHHQNVVLNTFEDSLSYKTALINGESKGVWIISDGTNSNEKRIVMKPNDIINVGDLIENNSDKWLCVNAEKDNPVNESGSIEKCNAQLKLKIGENKVKVGDDALGRPIYETTILYDNFPCVVKSKTRLSFQTDGAINLPEGRVFVLMQYNKSVDLDVQSTFELYGQNWTVVELDMTGVENDSGVLGIMAEREG